MDIGRLVLIDLYMYSVLEVDNFHRKWSVAQDYLNWKHQLLVTTTNEAW